MAAPMSEHDKAKKMDTPGTARDESFTFNMGRPCSNSSCVQRETEEARFRRCARCRSVWYCSLHCQKTHWRQQHSRECQTPAEGPMAQQPGVGDFSDTRAASAAHPTTTTGGARDAGPAEDAEDGGDTGQRECDGTTRQNRRREVDGEHKTPIKTDDSVVESVPFEVVAREITDSNSLSRTLQVVISVPSLESAAGVTAGVDGDHLKIFLRGFASEDGASASLSDPDISVSLMPELRVVSETVESCRLAFKPKARLLVARLLLVPIV